MTKEQILARAQERGLRRVLIVTALSLEMRAVLAHIVHVGSVVGRSGVIYECGEFSARGGDWLAVVAESGAGTHPAQQLVTYAHIDFDSFETVVFVGIAGSRKADAPIGSVIASSVLYLPYSGKYDAQMGFTARPHALSVDPRLIGSARKVVLDGEWATRIREPLREKFPEQADYPQPFPPAAFVAPIASLEAVSADPNSDVESLISRHYGDAYAVEMEGYGAAYAGYTERTPLIVVRGISDMRGGKAPKEDVLYQPVAAAHAAAFCFELLDVWGRFHPRQHEPTAGQGQQVDSSSLAQPRSASNDSPRTGRCVIVLNFDASLAEFPQAKAEQILEALKAATNDESLRIVGIEEGSVYLLLDGRAESFARIYSLETRAMLLRDFSVNLQEVLTEEKYRRPWPVEALLRRASQNLLEWPKELPDGTQLKRPELDEILSILRDNESSTTALLGAPGSGKSALLAQLGHELAAQGVLFVAIKADLLDLHIESEEALTDSLQLPHRLSSLLVSASRTRQVVLLLDQLDALAGYVDLKTGRLSVLLNLVRKVGGLKNVHIVLSARTFEYEHDTRLKSVKADSVTLALPPWSEVLQVLERHGVAAAGWPVDAKELMRVPQALATFLRLNERAQEPPFRKYQAMLDQLWTERILAQPNGASVAKLAATIAETMAEKETLWLAAARFEEQSEHVGVLIANGILANYDGGAGRIGFSHQTVFEHALARAFARGQGRLSSYVLERQASLFIRPKLWAALTYLREVEPSTYEDEFRTMWSQPDLRLHLRHMLIEFLGQQNSPSPVEAGFLEGALRSVNRRVGLQSIVGSGGWFALFGLTHIASAMREEREASVASAILSKAWAFARDRVVGLIRENWLPTPSFDGHIWQVLQDCPQWNDDVTRLATTVIERTNIAAVFFEHTISIVGVEQPEVALKLVSARLGRLLDEAVREAERRAAQSPPDGEEERAAWHMLNSPSEPITRVFESSNGWDTLDSIAKEKGELFVKYVWPHFQRAFAELRRVADESVRFGFSISCRLDLRFEGEHSLGLTEDPLLGALVTAVESFARDNENEFLEWLAEHESEDATPAQRIFAHALASQPQRYSERARKFLLDNSRRFYLGSAEDLSGTTKRLVREASPFWDDQQLADFIQQIFAHNLTLPADTPPKTRQRISALVRQTRLGILSSLPRGRLAPDVQKHVEAERRRFPDEKVGATFHGPEWIGPPMSTESMSLASEADIVNAFREVPDAAEWDHPTRWMKGGNVQLSRAFAEYAKTEPERAMRIVRQFEPSFGTRAAGYAIEAVAETANPHMILELIHLLNTRGFVGSEFREGAARAVDRLVRRDAAIDDETLVMLEEWLAEPVPIVALAEVDGPDEALGRDSLETEEPVGSVIWGSGVGSALPHGRFPILEAITQVLLARPDHDRLVALYAKHLRIEEPQNVWEALLRYFRYIRPTASSDLGAFILELFERYPNMIGTRDAAVMLAYLQWQTPDAVKQLLPRLRSAEVNHQTYGELVALIALVRAELKWPEPMLVEILQAGDMARARVGAAYTAVHLWSEPKNRRSASELLQAIVPRADKAGWAAIFELFTLVDEITPERDWIGLLEVIAKHLESAGNVNSTFVVERLQTLLPHEAALVARIARGLVANWRTDLGDPRTSTSGAVRDLVDLAITLHRLGPETREAGTSLFEDLLDINAYMARETLTEIDNRFGPELPAARRRLPRRARRARVRTRNSS